jgi:hypothetical protein
MKILFTTLLIVLFSFQLAFSQGGSNMSVNLLRNSSDSGDYFSPGDVLNMGTQDFTIEVKMFVNSFPPISETGAKIINKGLSTSATPQNAGYGLRVWDDNGVNKLIFMTNDGSSFNNIEADSLASGTCYHVAAVRESDNIRLYLDGNLVANSTTPTVLDVNNDLFFAIGALSRQPYEITTEFFDGQVDEIRIWTVVRNEVQIKAMMNDTLSAAYYSSLDSGLVAYYRCDELEDLGIGGDGADDVRDFSVNSFNADSYDEPVIAPTCNVVGVNSEINVIPDNYELKQNYPNPFNPSTKISWQSPVGSWQTLKVYDVLGKEVATLVNEEKPAGNYEVEFNTSTIEHHPSSGIYFYQLQAGSFVETRKMMLLK